MLISKKLKLKSENNINSRLHTDLSRLNTNEFSINTQLKNNKITKSIDLKKYYPSIKNPHKYFKELDLYTDAKKSFEIKLIENLHNLNFINKYPFDYIRKIDHLLKKKDKNHSK